MLSRTLAIGLLIAAPTSAQIASSMLTEGDALPGAPGFTADALNNVAANDVGGYMVLVNASDGVDTLSTAWGSADGVAAGTVLFQEGLIAGLNQTSWESSAGLSNTGAVCYSASGDNGPVGGFDSCWTDATPIAVEGDPSSVAGQFWRFASRPNITPSGMPWFVGGLTSTQGGSTENRGLFVGPLGTAVYIGGDAVPGLPFALSTANTVAFDVGFSEAGTHHIVEAQMASGDSFSDNVIVMNGAGLMLGGTLVREQTAVPVSVGGNGAENWDNFDFMGATDGGDWFFTGDTDGDTATDEIIVVNGAIAYREGDTIGGQVVSGFLEAARMNAAGDLAYIWDIGGGSLEALFVNDRLILAEGDPVDFDGDGSVDPGTAITAFSGLSNNLAFGEDGFLYFTADVDDGLGGNFEGFYRVSATAPPSFYCTPKTSSAGCVTTIATSSAAAPTSGANDYSVLASDVQGQKNGLLFAGISGPANTPFNGGTLCVSPPLKRGPVQFSNGSGPVACDGSYSQVVNDGTIVPAGLDAGPGNTGWYQWWYRDPANGAGDLGTALSDAVRLDFD